MSRAARALLLVNAAFELAVAAVCLLAPRLLLGSVASQVMRHAGCSVLVTHG